MNYRERYIGTLRGDLVDRLPYVESAKFNMAFAYNGVCNGVRDGWEQFGGDEEAVRRHFGFDNVGIPLGFEHVPVDWYAVPRFPTPDVERGDGYRRYVDDRYGRIVKSIPAGPGRPIRVRIFEDHVVRDRSDWLEVRSRFRPSVEGRFPADWDAWCEHSKRASHPIVLDVRDSISTIGNLLGEDRWFVAFYEDPDLVREMADWLSGLTRVCLEKVLSEARVDMVRVGSDGVPMVGPKVISDYFIEHEQKNIEIVRSFGIDLVCLQGRGDIRHCIPPYREIGVNGLCYIMEAGPSDYLSEILQTYGDDLFYLHAIDGRALLGDNEAIEREVSSKVALACRYRMIPDLHVTHILPEVRFPQYRRYADALRSAIFGSGKGG